jgi:hypothetical protein
VFGKIVTASDRLPIPGSTVRAGPQNAAAAMSSLRGFTTARFRWHPGTLRIASDPPRRHCGQRQRSKGRMRPRSLSRLGVENKALTPDPLLSVPCRLSITLRCVDPDGLRLDIHPLPLLQSSQSSYLEADRPRRASVKRPERAFSFGSGKNTFPLAGILARSMRQILVLDRRTRPWFSFRIQK